MMIAMVYTSRATQDFNQPQLEALLDICRTHNQKHGITGLLLYRDREFIQVLEGEEKDVIETYQRIRKDGRHDDIEAIFKEPIEERYFPFWAMGQCDPNKSKYLRDQPLHEIKYNKVSVMQLLKDFRNGAM